MKATDLRICSIGSANIDIRSFSINYETNLVVYDETVTRELEADFFEDLEHWSRSLSMSTTRERRVSLAGFQGIIVISAKTRRS